MRRVLLFLLLAISSLYSHSQNLSYTCPRDTVLGCGVNCFNLNVKFPDLRGLGPDYTVSDVSTDLPCYPLVPPGGPGPSANVTIDDTYSAVIPLPFTFPFYAKNYNSLVISTNGYVSFDISNAGGDSHYEILKNGGALSATSGSPLDLPSTLYDKALIMGVYHDMDPSITSPGKQIKYEVFGTAPNRKWILSFNKLGLYNCTSLLNNTSQIILHETTGIIEVTTLAQQICTSWNQGRAMIGLQDSARTKGIMPPGRMASSTPWGTSSMNETWRFTPVGGPILYRSMQLLDGAGAVVATGDTSRLDANTFGWTFNNICPATNAPTLYVVKTTYVRLNDPTQTVYSLDTIRVTKNAFPAITSSSNTTCGASIGSVTATPTGGTWPFTYSLNSGPAQADSIFTNLPAGTYSVTITDANGCDNVVTAIVGTTSSLTSTATQTNVSCPGNSDGTITVTPTSGTAPYNYTINGGPSQVSNVFTGLAPGTYTIVFIDAAGCQGSVVRTLTQGAGITGNSSATATSCAGVNNGTITANGSGGVAPYTYSIDGGPFQATNVFTGLSSGAHTITIQDSRGCSVTITRNVNSGSGLAATSSSTATDCPSASNGTITVTPTNGTGPYTFSIDGGPSQPTGVFTNLTDGSHTIIFKDANNCTGTIVSTVATGTSLSATAVATTTSCPTRNDGTITVTASGTGPYTYTLNPGNVIQASPVFTGLAAGTYTITFASVNGCGGSVTTNPVVPAGPSLTSAVTTVNAPVCANINDGTITIVPAGVAPYTFTLTPGVTQASPTFTNLAPGPYTYNFTDGNGCTGTGSFTLASNPSLRSPSVKVAPLCNGNNNGSITFNISGGVAPYQYALAPYATYQTSNVFPDLIAGNYNFRIKDAVGCTKDTTIQLAQPAVLTASASNSKVATCNGNDGTITITAAGGTTPYQYSINNGVNYQSPNIFTAPDTGFYANIKVRDTKGCLVNTSATVALLDTMRLELGAAQTICVGSSVTLQPQTNAATTIFTWTAQNVPITTLSDPGIKNPVATPQDTAVYILNAQWGICKRNDNVIINVLHKPIVSAGLDTAICNQATQTIPSVATLMGSATNLSGTINYAWEPANKVTFPTQAVTPAKTDSTQNFILTVTDNYGCNFVVKDTVTVFVQPPVQAFAGRDTIAMLNRPHQLMASGGTGYLWSPSGPLNDAHLQNPLATLTADTRFTVVVTDIAGCEGYDTVFVKAYDGPVYYVPNAFSPNGDGRNDIFRAIPSGIASTEYFRVFNRFGELLFETNQWLKGWDGTYRGKPQPVGTYVWMVKGKDQNGRVVEQKGTVIIVH